MAPWGAKEETGKPAAAEARDEQMGGESQQEGEKVERRAGVRAKVSSLITRGNRALSDGSLKGLWARHVVAETAVFVEQVLEDCG